MTLDEAKIILAAYRIGELDPADANTRAALELAASDPELAAWWENEQDFDRAFARKFASITPPRELAAIIMRGGATIFLARRLISESTGEKLEDAPASVQEAIVKSVPVEKLVPFRPETLIESESVASRLKPSWWRRVVPLSMAATAAALILGLFIMLSSPKLSAQSHAELSAFEKYAVGRSGANAPPFRKGASLNDLQDYLQANEAPLPHELPHRLGNVTIVGVSADTWSSHHYAYFILESGKSKLHLFVLNREEFPNDSVDEDPDRDVVDPYVAELWTEDHEVFVLLRPTESPAP
jgi:hypothetical protein